MVNPQGLSPLFSKRQLPSEASERNDLKRWGVGSRETGNMITQRVRNTNHGKGKVLLSAVNLSV